MGKKRKEYDFSAFDQAVKEPTTDPVNTDPKYDFSAFDKAVKKKEDTTGDSSTGSLDTAQELEKSFQETNDIYKERVKSLSALRGQLEEFPEERKSSEEGLGEYNSMVTQYNKVLEEANNTYKQLEALQGTIQERTVQERNENLDKQSELFDALGIGQEELEQITSQLEGMTLPDGTPVTLADIPAEEVARMITGKGLDEAIEAEDRDISDRVFGSFGRSVKKVLGYQMPAGASATVSNLLDEFENETREDLLFRAIDYVAPGTLDAVTKPIRDLQVATFEWGRKHLEKGEEIPIIQSISQIKRPLDVIDFVSASVGQGMAQIIPAIATRGASSGLQEIGLTYIEGVKRIAQEKGMTPEDVIRLGLDEAEVARTYGTIQALMDRLGAMKVLKTIKPGAIAKDLRRRGMQWLKGAASSAKTEFLTEGAQGASQQLAVSQMAGNNMLEGATQLDWTQIFDEALAGAIGGGGVSAIGVIAQKGINKLSKLKSKKNKTEGETKEYEELLDKVAQTAKKYGDTRSEEEIKDFVEDGIIEVSNDEFTETDIEAEIENDGVQPEPEVETKPSTNEPIEGKPTVKDKVEEKKLPGTKKDTERLGETAKTGESQSESVEPRVDSPEENRKRGSVIRDGAEYKRQEPVKAAKGKEVNIKFASKVDQKGSYAVMEADQVQPSHIEGRRNNFHFIPEAQPKNRDSAFGQSGAKGAMDIAQHLDPEQVAASPNPYSGAPTVNSRGEAIQGNSRADALKMYWKNNPDDPAGYKQYLIDNAEQFGVDPEEIKAMKAPVLTRMLPVSDPRAIELGNYDVKDVETGGQRRLDPKQTSAKINTEGRRELLEILLGGKGETLSEMIRSKADAISNALYKKNAINSTQLETIISKTGGVNAKGVEDLAGVFKQFLFDGGDTHLPELYDQLPDRVQKGIGKAIPSILRAKEPITKEIQNAIIGYVDFINSKIPSIETWASQIDMIDGVSPNQIYTPLELYLVDKFSKSKTQKEVAELFNQYEALTSDNPGDLFNPEGEKGLSPQEAIKQLTGIDYGQSTAKDPKRGGEKKTDTGKSEKKPSEKRPKQDKEIDDLFTELDDALDKPETKAPSKGPKVRFRYFDGTEREGEVLSKTTTGKVTISSNGLTYTVPEGNIISEDKKGKSTPTPKGKTTQNEGPKVNLPQPKKKRSAKVEKELDDLFGEMDDVLKQSRGRLSSGVDPKVAIVGAKIAAKYIELGVTKFGEIISEVYDRYGEPGVRKYFQAIKGGYASVLATAENPEDLSSFEEVRSSNVDDVINTIKTQDNEPSTASDLEPDSGGSQSNEPLGREDVSPDRGGDRPGPTGRSEATEEQVQQQGDTELPDGDATTDGTTGDKRVRGEQPRPSQRIARGTDSERGSVPDDDGVQSGKSGPKRPGEFTPGQAEGKLSLKEKRKLQKEAESVETITGDIANIRESLPYLLPAQQEDVLAAENRFFPEDPKEGQLDKGILFTNGTGTGKTYTGLGIAKRFHKRGIKDQLIVVPTAEKAKDWIEDANNLQLEVTQLKDTKDAGKGIVITTYANFRDNLALLKRNFGLVLYDESHRINSNEAGETTAGQTKHYQITNPPSYAKLKAKEDIGYHPKLQALEKKYDDRYYNSDHSAKYNSAKEKLDAQLEAKTQELVDATKVVFLSATPFAYHKSLKYADGYLFRITEGINDEGFAGYNQGDAYDKFFMENFGYRMRYNKLTAPEAGVNVGLMEREFQERLKKEGALVARKLDVPHDYSREFILAEDGIGATIDQGLEVISENSERWKLLSELARKKFNYNYKSQLLEAIKAKHMVERAKKHIGMGRKVIIFHTYVNNLPSHPFDFANMDFGKMEPDQRMVLMMEIAEFNREYPEYHKLDLKGLANPHITFKQAFGDEAGYFNGTYPNKVKSQAVADFNKDEGGKDLIVIQMEAGKEGISLHDVTGNKQRVVLNLALPIKPTDAVQTEGRAYRVGQASDAIMEYAVLHTSFEKSIFGNKINQRVKTVENLALGHESRNLEDAFKEGYKEVTTEDPNDNQGVGGKEKDTIFGGISDFERSKTYYYARAKRTSKTKSAEGNDYFATPEPLGYKMVEWLYANSNDSHLEPSAGHGAIARFFSEHTNNTVIEPSYKLRADLSINSSFDRMEETNFEDYHIVNKHDGIVMNPPYGTASKTAWEHTEKGLKHLKDSGRLISIVPAGGSLDKRMDAFMESKEAEGIFLTARINLPGVTFKRAGTNVNTQILVFDKQNTEIGQDQISPTRNIDLTGHDTIESLFDAIEDMDLPGRYRNPKVVEQNQESKPSGFSEADGTIKPLANVDTYTTKNGAEMASVKLTKFVERGEFVRFRTQAEKMGGYYGNRIRKFLFKDQETADKFADFVNTGNLPEDNGPADSMDVYNMPQSKGATPMGKYENRVTLENGQPMKIHDRAKRLAKKYNPNSTLGQNFTSPGSEGTYYGDTGNVRLKGLNKLSVVMHELVHALDKGNGVIENLINSTGHGDPIRNSLTNLYVEYYPKGKADHPLRVRMMEGYAMLIQKYIETPSEIKEKYPDLIDAFIKPDGAHSFPEIGEFIADAEQIIADYQRLNPLQKYAARTASEDIRDDYKKKSGTFLKVDQEVFDQIALIEHLAKRDGSHMTPDDASLYIRMGSNAVQMAHRNISNERNRYWNIDANGEHKQVLPFNFRTIQKRLGARGDDFAGFLVARRFLFDHKRIEELKDEREDWEDPDKLFDIMEQLEISEENAQRLIDAKIAELTAEIDRMESIMRNEGIYEENDIIPQELEDINAAYETGQNEFGVEEKMLDALMAEDVKFASNPLVQLISKETAEKYLSNEGYSPFKRLAYDELAGENDEVPAVKASGKGKISSFMQRRGGDKPILNPFMGAMLNHMEITRKGMKQMVYNKLLESAKKNPEINSDFIQILPRYNPDLDGKDGIITARDNYKRKQMKVDADIQRVIDEVFDYYNMHLVEKALVTASQLFRAGTTGLFPAFAISNTLMDQISAAMNTRNGFIPFVSSLKYMAKPALNQLTRGMLFNDSESAQYLKEYLYLANTSQTFYSGSAADTQRLKDDIVNKVTGFQKLGRYLGKAMDLLALPGNASEILTRGTEYIMARKAGKSQVVALEEAGRVSTPFHHIGRLGDTSGNRVGKTWVRSVPYWNASMQVLRQSVRALGTKEGRLRASFIVSALSAASVSSVLYMLDLEDDDPRLQILITAPPDILTKYLFFPSPWSKTLIKIRVPDQFNWLTSMLNMYLIESAGKTKYSLREYAEAGTAWLPQQINPTNGYQMLYSAVPHLFKPGLETMTNVKTWPNVRPLESMRDKSLPPEFRFNQYTSPLAIELGDQLGMSPKKIDHLIGGYFGRTSKFFTGKETNPFDFEDVFTREMYLQSSRQVQNMYDTDDKVSGKLKAYRMGVEYSKEEVKRLRTMSRQISRAKAYLEQFKRVDGEKYPIKAEKIRAKFFEAIRELEDTEYK